MLVSPTKAIELYKVSKPTLYNDMRQGTLSYKLDERKRRKLDVSELDRLYEKRRIETPENERANVSMAETLNESYAIGSHGRLETLEQEIDFLKRELSGKESEVKRWEDAFYRAQATADKITALITDQSQKDKDKKENDDKAVQWQRYIQGLEKRLANQEKVSAEREERILQQNRVLKTELESEKKKPFWEKLFGS